MKRLVPILLVPVGLVIGWSLAASKFASPNETSSAPMSDRKDRIHRTQQEILLRQMLGEYEQQLLESERATTSLEKVQALRDNFSYGGDDLSRIVDLGPESALQELLHDPGASSDLCVKIATVWARREPAKALRFFKNHRNFRAADCLAATLHQAFAIHPDLVIETIRSQSRTWQQRHLEDLITAKYPLKNSTETEAPPIRDPFRSEEEEEDDSYTKLLGPEILHAFEDPELREKAEELLAPSPPESVTSEAMDERDSPALDLANFSNVGEQHDAFQKRWKENRDELLAEVIEKGSYEARSLAILNTYDDFPLRYDEWPEALQKLEEDMKKLQVIPSHPPYRYPAGDLLGGDLPTQWIARQPLALQRAWISKFVENWAQSEPADAVEWTLTMTETSQRNVAMQRGLIIWAHQDPQAAIPFVEALPPGDLRDSSISNAAASWSRIDPDQARSWLNSLPESPARNRALKRIKE